MTIQKIVPIKGPSLLKDLRKASRGPRVGRKDRIENVLRQHCVNRIVRLVILNLY
jgi:hypothetical protein